MCSTSVAFACLMVMSASLLLLMTYPFISENMSFEFVKIITDEIYRRFVNKEEKKFFQKFVMKLLDKNRSITACVTTNRKGKLSANYGPLSQKYVPGVSGTAALSQTNYQ